MAATVQRSMFQLSNTHMEAEAVNFDIKIAENARYSPTIIESDSQEVGDLILSKKDNITEISWIIVDIQKSIQRFNQFSIHHIPRECNVIAHSLTKKALDFENPIMWQ